MGEYYRWVNVDRKEYMSPADFGYGSKRYESCGYTNEVLGALRNLLFNEWKGCRVFWMGDESLLPENNDSDLFSIMKAQCDALGSRGYMFDTVCETYRNVSSLFKAAEKEVKEEIGYYIENLECGMDDAVNEYGVNPSSPYDGLFLREGCNFRFIINMTKKVAYAFGSTRMLYKDGKESDYADPLPGLLGYGRGYKPGEWIGDFIEVADELPKDITLLENISLDW